MNNKGMHVFLEDPYSQIEVEMISMDIVVGLSKTLGDI